jgi:hypothetical protein
MTMKQKAVEEERFTTRLEKSKRRSDERGGRMNAREVWWGSLAEVLVYLLSFNPLLLLYSVFAIP